MHTLLLLLWSCKINEIQHDGILTEDEKDCLCDFASKFNQPSLHSLNRKYFMRLGHFILAENGTDICDSAFWHKKLLM